MSAYPDNVIVLADHRRESFDLRVRTDRVRLPGAAEARLVTNSEPPEPFGLEVFLRRAMIVMADPPADPDAPAAPLIPLHAPASA